ncbi:hypothetical protein BJV74DRAFT_835047 [Russula compacta]|nr:hypothetical protein BJV74DRAFT_835047 [Russula compacta]
MSSRVEASHDLRERATRLRSEATAVSVESASNAQGPREFEIAYKQALSLERRSIFGLNTLLENLSSWVAITDTDGLSNGVTLERLRELSYAWAKARDSVREALVTLTSEPAQRLFYRSASLAWKCRRSPIRRWLTSLLCFS